MNDNQIMSFSEIISKYRNDDFEKADRISTVWKKVVLKVRSNRYESEDSEKRMPIGERLANNTRVIDLKNGILLVEADHPGWIQYLKTYQKFIINGLKMNLPDLKIDSMGFRLKGTDISLKDTYEDQVEKSKKEMEEKLNKQEKEVEKLITTKKGDEKKDIGNTLPPELFAKLEAIKESMLTNSEN